GNQRRPLPSLVFLAASDAAATSSIERVPIVDSENGMPAFAAADAPASSPSECMKRVNPVGAMPKGREDFPPAMVVDRSTSGVECKIFGISWTFLKAS